MKPPIFYASSFENKQLPHAKNTRGFTLVEVMVVIVILAIFASMIGVSVGKSDTQKNRAYYEHLQDSLSYIRLTAAERMQPMGIRIVMGENDKELVEVVKLDNAYAAYQNNNTSDSPKNMMELSGMSMQGESETPTWTVVEDIVLPELPNDLEVIINQLDTEVSQRELQPWFSSNEGQSADIPLVMWFGTGQATPAVLELRYQDRLVGDVITIQPDGGVSLGN